MKGRSLDNIWTDFLITPQLHPGEANLSSLKDKAASLKMGMALSIYLIIANWGWSPARFAGVPFNCDRTFYIKRLCIGLYNIKHSNGAI